MGAPAYGSLAIVMFVVLSGCSVPAESGPGDAAARSMRLDALLLVANEDMQGSIEDLQRAHAVLALAREMDPDDARSADGLGCLAFRLGKFEQAAQLFDSASRLDPSYSRAKAHLGLVKLLRGDFHNARILMEAAIRLDPLDPETRNNLAVLEYVEDRGDGKSRTELLKADALGGPGVVKTNLEILSNVGK